MGNLIASFQISLRSCIFSLVVLGSSSPNCGDEVKSYPTPTNNLYALGSNPLSFLLLRKNPYHVQSLEGLTNFCVSFLEISCKFGR